MINKEVVDMIERKYKLTMGFIYHNHLVLKIDPQSIPSRGLQKKIIRHCDQLQKEVNFKSVPLRA